MKKKCIYQCELSRTERTSSNVSLCKCRVCVWFRQPDKTHFSSNTKMNFLLWNLWHIAVGILRFIIKDDFFF